jgi:hypothetical protein
MDGESMTSMIGYTVAGAPTVTITSPTDASYTQGQTVDASYSCADGSDGPGIQSCTGTVANGSAIKTKTTGMQTFLVTATSSDGQSTTQSVSYTVTPRFGGIGLFHISATLTSSGAGVAGQSVTFTAGHIRLCTATTSKVGVAGCTLPFAQEATVLRSNAYTATYTATSRYAGSMSTIPAVVYCNGWGAWHPNSPAPGGHPTSGYRLGLYSRFRRAPPPGGSLGVGLRVRGSGRFGMDETSRRTEVGSSCLAAVVVA